MASRYFCGAVDNLWNNAGNWDAVSGGGGGGAGVPTNADDVFFDNLSPGCNMDVNGVCLTIDQTGYVNQLAMLGFTLTVHGTTVLLVSGGYSQGGATPEIDLVAAAGTVDITTGGAAGDEIWSMRVGNAGAGATYRQLSALTIMTSLDLVNGVWQTNNFDLTVQDIIFAATMLANGFVAGTSTITCSTIDWNANAQVINMGTSTFYFDAMASNIAMDGATGGLVLNFHNLTVDTGAGGTFLYDGTFGLGVLNVNNIFLVTSGVVQRGGTGVGIRVQSTLANGFQPHATDVMDCPIIVQPRAVAGTTVTIPEHINNLSMSLIRDKGTYGTCVYQLTGAIATGDVLVYSYGGASTVQAATVDFNGNNWTVTGNAVFGNGTNFSGTATIGAATFAISGNLTHLGNRNADTRIFVLAGGTLSVGGNFTHTGAVSTTGQTIAMSAGASVVVGGNWNTTPALVWAPADPADTSAVYFSAVGPFAIVCAAGEEWPIVVINGGGSTTLPNGFSCYDLDIQAGLITAGNPLTVRRNLANAGTFTASAATNIGSSFVNTGTFIGVGSVVTARAPVCSISGFDPVTLTMGDTCLRLQLQATMSITTFIVADRRLPGVIQFLAGGTFTIGTFFSQIASTDGVVQMVSSVAGTDYTWNVTTAITSLTNIWPRDCDAGASAIPPAGDITNKNLGNNTGWTLIVPGLFGVISEDAGQDLLAAGGIGPINYCWLVADSAANLVLAVAAFAGGGNNWHRKTNIPYAMLDNLELGSTVWIAMGLVDDRDRRVAPGAADFVTGVVVKPESGGGGGGGGIVASPETAWV